MRPKKKKKEKWFRKWLNQLKIGFWNPLSYSFERHSYCKALKYDILGLSELFEYITSKPKTGLKGAHGSTAQPQQRTKTTRAQTLQPEWQ